MPTRKFAPRAGAYWPAASAGWPQMFSPATNRAIVRDDWAYGDAVLGTEFTGFNDVRYFDEYDPAICDPRARLRTYRKMRTEETTIAAMLFLINRMLQTVRWEVKGNRKEWVHDQFFNRLRRPFPTLLNEIQTFLVYGFSLFEKIFIVREDNTIGLWDLAPRPQQSIERWGVETAPYVSYDEILYVEQDARALNFERIQFHNPDYADIPNEPVRIPYAKLVHFRNQAEDNHPEGMSILRPCYRSWRMLRDVERSEILAVDRDLNGLPVFSIPAAMLESNDPRVRDAVAAYQAMAQGIRVNNQSGVILPSDLWRNQDGTYTNMPKVDLKLMSSGGTRLINTDQVVRRLQAAIARTIMADFIVLGSGTASGSYNLGQDKSDLFVTAVGGWLNYISDKLNADVIPDLWALNGWGGDPARIEPGSVQKMDILKISQAMYQLAQSGMTVFPTKDGGVEDALMDYMDLPGGERAEKPPLNIYDPDPPKTTTASGGK